MRAGIVHAHFFLGHYDEAVSWAQIALQDDPDHQPSLRIGAASNAMAGRLEQAQATAARLLQLHPTLRISNLKDVLGPYQRTDLSRYEEGLRKAGLPE
jgi:adenylate cyclase